MHFQVSSSEAAQTRHPVEVNGRTYMISNYVGSGPKLGRYVEGNERNDDRLPQGFLVEQPSGAVTPPHFHDHPQFQVVVAGHGRIGKHAAGPVSIHYVNGHTPYGPVVAGAEGVRYFTLRRSWDAGAKYMPASAARLVKGNQRTLVTADLPPAGPAALAALDAPTTAVVMGPEDDGLAAWMLRAGPGAAVVAPEPAGGDGQYHVVIAGSAVADGQALDLWSCAYVTGDGEALGYTAGPDGLELLVCQFPRR
jgi:hypothetical protein